MPVFPFGELAPDQADLSNPGLIDVRNVFPGPSGYLPVKSFVAATTALTARPRGAITARDQSGTVYQYAGDETKLYQNVDGTWTDKSIGGGYATGTNEIWEFAAWKNKILATNYTNNPQSITFGGANFANLTTALRARHIAVVRDFVVLANTFDATDNDVPSRVRWSAFNDETNWTVSASTLADYQDLKISKIERVFGGEYGVIMQPERTWRMTFAGAPTVFQFDEVLPGIGVIAPGAAAQDGDIVYFLSHKGFYALEHGAKPTPIGAGKIDDFVREDLDLSNLHRISAVADPASKRFLIAYPGASNVGGRPNRILVYDRAYDRWSIIDEEVELIWRAAGSSVTLDSSATAGDPDDLDDPAADISFDDPRWVGGTPVLSAFDEAFKSGFFNGVTKTATLTTRDFAFGDGSRAQLNGFRALVQGGTVAARVGTRNSLSDSISFGSSLSARSEQRFTTRANARYHRFEFTLSGAWKHAIGLEIGRNDLRSGGMRG